MIHTAESVYKELDKLFPFKISGDFTEKFGGRDNSGIIINCGGKVEKILWSLDFSATAVENALENKCDLIITHHPAIYNGIYNIDIDTPQGYALVECIKNNISVISMHLNLDMAEGGVDATLADVMQPLSVRTIQDLGGGIGYGKALKINKTTLGSLRDLYRECCNTDKILMYGEENTLITEAATFCGGGLDDNLLAQVNGQLIVASDVKHHIIQAAIERGINLLIIPHYAAENFSFREIYDRTKDTINLESLFFEDKYFL